MLECTDPWSWVNNEAGSEAEMKFEASNVIGQMTVVLQITPPQEEWHQLWSLSIIITHHSLWIL